MNRVTRMSHIGFSLSHGMTVARDPRDDGYACAVEAQMWKPNSAKKLMPFFSGVFGKIDNTVPLGFFCAAHEGEKVGMQRRGVDAITFCRKADSAALQIYVAQWDSGFGDSTTLSHCNQPRIRHPWLLLPKCGFDF